MGYTQEKIAELEDGKDSLLRQIRAVIQQEREELNEAKKIVLNETLMRLKADWHRCVTTIERLQKGERPDIPPDRLRVELANTLHKKFHLIDFDDAEGVFKSLLAQFENCDGAVVLVQSSQHRMGTLYSQRVRELLNSKGGVHPFPTISFTTDEATKNELISRLCQSVGIPFTDSALEMSERLAQMVQVLLDAIDEGRTLLIEINCEDIDSIFLKWFIQDFWKQFQSQLAQACLHKSRLRVIILLTAHFEVACDDDLMSCICHELSSFQNQLMFEISLLAQWQEKQIKDWLYEQLAEELIYHGYPASEFPKLAHRVMRDANGIPRQVCNELTGTTLDWLVNHLTQPHIHF